ncbi:MAG: sigma 54-interacting transcriptional regulator [Desulfobacteraceae bacterium]|nr:sigma 54-interacting transcriptional regulator [Desulfobacteraceae bacterium]MBC2757832.1 sigma 54-interacting transcriptional regulator [Desulfobacteraceae bacterium]
MQPHISDVFNSEFEHLLLESMADGVFTLDENGIITSWNPAMERITGYTTEEAVGESCSLLNFNRCFSKSCPAGIIECGIYKHGRIDGKECFLKHKNGNDVPVIKSARILKDKTGGVRGVVETVTNLTELHKARREAEEANRRMGEIYRFDNIIGKSSAMQRIFSTIKAAASSDATILVQGESGTGKELVAGAVHYNSSRADMPFITVNSSALSESLLESELFGHVKGAFTGAVRDRIGRFEKAEGGTLFLDEIGELSPFIQVKLLRVLQERELERVGESEKRKIDIRVITATNRNLYSLVKSGKFREDLYYRLKVFPINIPPLRERKKDIPILISHFIKLQDNKTGKRITGVTQQAMRILMDYNWPGNVRELENAIEHAFVLCENEHIDIFDLPVEIRRIEYQLDSTKLHEADERTGTIRKKMTREFLLETLEASNWNKAEVARRVGVSRAAIWKYMKKWNIPTAKP